MRVAKMHQDVLLPEHIQQESQSAPAMSLSVPESPPIPPVCCKPQEAGDWQ